MPMCLRKDLPPRLRREDGTPLDWCEITSPPYSIVIPCEYIQDMNGSEYRSATTPKPLHPFLRITRSESISSLSMRTVSISARPCRDRSHPWRGLFNHKKSPSRIVPVPPGQPSSFVWAKVARIPLTPDIKRPASRASPVRRKWLS